LIGAPKQPSSLSWLIRRTLSRHLGIRMTAHQFRHLVAELILADDTSPASFEMARQLLGHGNLSTTMSFYAEPNTLRAGRRHTALLEKQMDATAKELTPRGDKPRGNGSPKNRRPR
jgi:integrase